MLPLDRRGLLGGLARLRFFLRLVYVFSHCCADAETGTVGIEHIGALANARSGQVSCSEKFYIFKVGTEVRLVRTEGVTL